MSKVSEPNVRVHSSQGPTQRSQARSNSGLHTKTLSQTITRTNKRQGCNLVVECMPITYKVLSSNPMLGGAVSSYVDLSVGD